MYRTIDIQFSRRRPSRDKRRPHFLLSLLIATTVLFSAGRSWAKDIFKQQRVIALPGDGGDPLGSLPDGRIVCVTPDAQVHIETVAGSGFFETAAVLADADFSSFGVAFTEVSPDGNWLAVGNNGGAAFGRYEVGVFNTSDFSGRWMGRLPPGETGGILHYSAVWLDNRHLALAGGQFGAPSFVDALDTQSSPTTSPKLTRIVDQIGGASAGIALDASGNLVTGNGFTGDGPSRTGAVHVIPAQAWRDTLRQGSAPVRFETNSIPIVRTLSAAGLTFDGRGNLWIGGKDVFGSNPSNERDFIAVVDARAYETVLNGGPAISSSNDTTKVTRLDPGVNQDDQTYVAHFNAATDEVLVRDTNTNVAYSYRPQASTASAPVMPVTWLAAMGIAMVLGSTGMRLRRPVTA